MKPFQRELFAAQKQNNYLKKILKIKKEANRRIEKLEGIVTELGRRKYSGNVAIGTSPENLFYLSYGYYLYCRKMI